MAENKTILGMPSSCVGCREGLDFVLDIILGDDEKKLKQLQICEKCRARLVHIVKKVFGKEKNNGRE